MAPHLLVALGEHAGQLYHKRLHRQRGFGHIFGTLLRGFENMLRDFTRNGPSGSAVFDILSLPSCGSLEAR